MKVNKNAFRILFIGKKETAYFIEEIAAKEHDLYHIQLDFLKEQAHIEEQKREILLAANSGYDFLIYDVGSYIEDAEVIAKTIFEIRKANQIKPIVMVDTINEKNHMIKCLLDKDIKNFINKSVATTTDLKEELIKNITRYYDANGREEIEAIQKKVEEEKEDLKQIRTIGVAGGYHRIGTTTQAIQIVKYLNYKGYTACLVEINDTRYDNIVQRNKVPKEKLSFVEKIGVVFEAEEKNEELGYIKFNQIDLYYKPEKLPEILKKGYDFYVYDYGVYSSPNFNKTAFLKDDEKIFILSGNPVEMDSTVIISSNHSYKDCKFIFSFTSESGKEDLLDFFSSYMGDGSGKRCFFAGYTPDPFLLANALLYDELLQVEEKNAENVEKKKKRFFSKKKK